MTKSKQSNKKRQSRRGRNPSKQVQMIPRPPPISDYTVRHSTRLRFTANTAIDMAVTFADLLDTILLARTTVLGSDLFFAVKVRFVEVWALSAIGTASNVSVTYGGVGVSSIGDQKMHTDSSMGIEPAHVLARPSARSLAATYQVTGSGEAFLINCPTGSVVDVGLSFVGAYGQPVAAQNALVGAGAGAIYLRGLDGLPVASTKLPPINVDYSI
jgi:hypothetical protein